MTYNINGEKFYFVETNDKQIKVYHYIKNKWSQGRTYICTCSDIEMAKKSATKYSM